MRHRRGNVAPLLDAARVAATAYSTTGTRFQLQARGRVIEGVHGAGVVSYQPLALLPGNPMLNAITQPAPAADLMKTKVHEGTGTSEKDPYVRTLPNQRSVPPESSVLQSQSIVAPTVDECSAIGTKWGGMGYWHNEKFPRLAVFLDQLLVPNVPPLSPVAESLLSMFETTAIPKLAADDEDRRELSGLWNGALMRMEKAVNEHIFERERFESTLLSVVEEITAKMRKLSLSGQEGFLAIEALRRQTLLKRNAYIQKHLIDVVGNSTYFGYGDFVWQVFFTAVEAHKEQLLSPQVTTEAIRTAWDAIMHQDLVRLPEVTGIVALYLTLVCIKASWDLAPSGFKHLSSNMEEGIRQNAETLQKDVLVFLHPVIKRKFVVKSLTALLQGPSLNDLSKALWENGLHTISQEVALCAAMNRNEKLLEDDVVNVVERFESKSEVKTILSSLMGGTDAGVRSTVAKVFGINTTTATVNWDAVMQSVDWSNNWRRLATSLLSDTAVLSAIQKLVMNAIGAKGVSKFLFTEKYGEELRSVMELREEREACKKRKVDQIIRELSSFEKVDTSLYILRQVGVDMRELGEAAAAIRDKSAVPRPQVDDELVLRVLHAVGRRHTNWLQAGVIQLSLDDPLDALRWMMHIFIRVAYVPQAGAAAIARLARRRIGPVGIEPHQFNVPAEIGFVEQYDNLQYKRYDWQGWYQRMVDVHNRNVSVRCHISDLHRLDGNGATFVDMQSERRLRILAQERVGMGVLKLDSDKYEDQADNITFGTTKLSELLAEARKAQLGEEYWPSVELKVRKPSGQSKAHYSLIDYERIEKRSKELYEKYRDAKKRSLFVTPMDMWLEVKGMQVRKSAENADEHGYTIDTLQGMLDSDDSEKQ